MAFGQPMGVSLPAAQPLDQLPAGGPLASAFAPLQAPHSKINWLGVLADALSGAAGQTPLYTQGLLQQRQQDREESRYQLRQNAELEQQKGLYLWKQAHPDTPQPDGYERALSAAGYAPGTPEYAQRMLDHVNAADDPIVTVSLPGNRIYSGPRSGLATALSGSVDGPTKPVGKLTPLGAGGPTSGSGGFRTGKH